MTSQHSPEYVYFVSYQFANQRGPGFGSMTLKMTDRVTDSTGVNTMTDYIRTSQGFGSVVLLNIQLLNGPADQA